jgi:HK97 family phage major capsid protein
MMNRKDLIAHAKSAGWDGEGGLDGLKSFWEGEGFGDLMVGKERHKFTDFDGIWAKTVTVEIKADAGEDIQVVDGSQAETEAEGEDDEMEDEESSEKSVKAARDAKHAKVKAREAERKQAEREASRKTFAPIRPGASVRVGGDALKMKAYDRAVRDGSTYRGDRPVIGDAERVKALGALARLHALGPHGYGQKSTDTAIVKDMGLGQNLTGGALVFGEFAPELIENIEEHGAARRAIGVTDMAEGEKTVARLGADVTVYDVGEGSSITDSTPSLGNVKLIASKTAALIKESNELANDSAFDVGLILSRSIPRAMAKWEDESIFLGQHNRTGVLDLIGANTTYDAAFSSAWSEVEIDDIQAMIALAPAWAKDDPNAGFVCSEGWAQQAFMKFGLDAGGNDGNNIFNGFGELRFNGFPIYISQVMPKARDGGDDIVCLFGAWSRACKFGVVRGSEQMATSDQRYFDSDQIAFRYTQRWAHSLHDVNNTANESGIVALKD